MQATHDIAATLNHLLEICRDGQNGFETAAKSVEEPSLKAELMQYSVQRRDFAQNLKSAIDSLGESIHDSGSVSAALHRGWINIKAAVARSDPYSILAECERGEDSAVAAYREAISGDALPESAAPLIDAQYDQVRRVHDRIKTLRDTFKNAPASPASPKIVAES